MKRKLLLGLSLLLVSFGYSQFTPIPDADFEDALIAKGIDTNPVRDGQVLTSAIENLKFLNLTSQDVLNFTKGAVGLGIKDVTGIKDFVSLDSLWVQDNELTNLDLEGITSLKLVRAFYNNLENINIDGLSNLETIGLVDNKLHTVNVATNTKLKQFDITRNSLTFLDIRGINTLERITAEENSNLTCILVEDATTAALYNANANFVLDGNTVFDENCVNPYTQIPDQNFEQSLIDQGYDSEGGVPNGLVLTQDLEAITSLDLSGTNFSGQDIVSLEGLDAFTGLTDLNISYNPLSLPNNDLVLTNTELETIIARNCNLDGASFPTILNEVVTLDLSNEDPRNTTLPNVNSFGSINGLGGVPNVITFRIEWNELTLLDVAGAPSIEQLFLGKNVDLAEIRNLNTLSNLIQMEADDNSLGLGNPIGTIDVTGNPNLEILNLDRSKITTIDLSNNSKLRLLSVSDVNLSPTIDLSANTSLTFLDLERSQLTSLALNANILLDRIELDGNDLTNLNLSQNVNLLNIKLANNKLTALDISDLTALTNVDVSDNPNLNCVLVANAATATNYNNDSNFIKNGTTVFSDNCNPIYDVQVSVSATREQDGNGFFVLRAANEPITLEFQALDQNGQELSNALLSDYDIQITTFGDPSRNAATGGNTSTLGVDFELLTNQAQNITVQNGQVDFLRPIMMQPDQLFEADEYFVIEITEADARINLKDSDGGVVRFPVRIIDNEVTNINLEWINNGAEPNQNARLKITSSLQNDTGAPMPFNILLNGGNATIGEDYQALTTPPAIPNGASSVEFDIIILNNDADSENEENFFATMSYAGSLPNNRVVIQEDIQEVMITDDGDSPQSNVNLKVELKGDVQVDMDENYFINEGGTIEIWVEATNPEETNNQIHSVSYNVTTSGEPEDYTLLSASPLYEFTVNSNANPDGKIEIRVNEDEFNDSEEYLEITLEGPPPWVVLEDGFVNTDFGVYQLVLPRIKIINTTSTETNITAEIDNIGGTEGQKNSEDELLPDVFTLKLKNLDGSPYIATEDISFPVLFKASEIDPAELSDYNPKSARLIELADGSTAKIVDLVVSEGGSTATLNVELPDEIDENEEHEFYTVTVMPPTNFNENINLPEPFTAKIIDDDGKFRVFYTIDDTNLFLADGPGAGCCANNNVEEGESIRFSFEAEKGALLNEEYKIAITYNQGTHPETLQEYAVEGQDEDFYNTAMHEDIFDADGKKTEIITSAVVTQNPDYNLSIKLNSDDDGDEKFAIELTSYSDNYILLSSRPYYPDFVINPTVKASLIVTDDTADEENHETNKGLFTIKLSGDGAPRPIEVFYTIEGSALNGTDYEMLDGSVFFMQGEKEKTIEIKAKPDNNPENDKTVTLTLEDNTGYSLDENMKRGTVTIPENDQDKIQFEVTLTANDTQIYEDPTKKNEGVFEVSIEPQNTSGSDLTINYSFIDGGVTYPAIEGEGNDFVQNGNGVLVFKSGESATQTITVTAQQDPETGNENTEIITLSLTEGNRYSAPQTSNATIEIISSEFDQTTLSNEALEVLVASNTCSNSVEGDIFVKNSSQFDFKATIQPGNITKELPGNSDIPFNNLKAGTYTVSFTFVDTNIELIPPSFEVTIQNLTGTNLLGQMVNLTSKTANLIVSGSKKYTVLNGTSEHFFEFNNYSENTLEIPIADGKNNLIIKGEAACQGTIETNLYLNKISVLPNPTDGVLKFLGFLLNEKAQISINDLSGKSILNHTTEVKNGILEVDISNHPPGLYLGMIHTKSGQKLSFKILKR